MNVIAGIFYESYLLLNKMALYLLFGFIFAGILHVFLKAQAIAKHLGKRKFSSVVTAALLDIPLPLCSCGVIPATLSLKRDGANTILLIGTIRSVITRFRKKICG